MSDPVESWILKYLGVAATGILSGLGAAMGWFRMHRVNLERLMADGHTRTHERIDQVRNELSLLAATQAAHSIDLKVQQANFDNHVGRLDEIREGTQAVNVKVDHLAEQLTRTLTEIVTEMKRTH